MTHAGVSTVENRGRVLVAMIAAALVLALLPVGAAHADGRLNMTVLSGADNVDAALAWSQHAFPGTSTNAILGRSDLPPDNLASGLLQGALDAPLLLNPSTTLDGDVKAELKRLEARTVHILGGLTAISSGVETALRAEGYATRRYSGPTRIETAQEIAASYGGSATTALLARAFGSSSDPTSSWADALAGGAWAADDEIPVLFTQTETLTASTRTYLQGSRIRNITILGGTAAINDSVKAQLEAMGIAVERVSGATRFATATAIAAERGYANAGAPASIVLADGQDTDGWAAGFAAAGFAVDKPIVLSNGSALPPETNTWFTGGSSAKNLIVAPYVTEAAANAAADKLSLLKAATVTLDATSFPSNGNITGKITPLDDVTSSAISGACVTDGTLTPNASTGAFSVPVTQTFTPGSCDVAVTVTYKNNVAKAHPFSITITGAGANVTVTDGPELTNVTLFSQTTDHVVLKFTFDEATDLQAAGQTLFKLVGFNGELHNPNHPTTGELAVREDTSDTAVVLASFQKAKYERSTTAVVLPGAVKDFDGLVNPEGSRGVQAVTMSAGRTDGPDLLSIVAATVDTGDAVTANYVVRVTYNFDEDATTKTIGQYKVIVKDSDSPVSAVSFVSGDTTKAHVVDFPAATNGGALFASNRANADAFRDKIARGFVDYTDATTYAVHDGENIPNIAHTALTGGAAMESGRPYLTSVSLSPATSTAKLVFSEPVDSAMSAGNFFIYDHSGTVTPASGAVRDIDDTKTVKLTFPPGKVDDQATAAGHKASAVEGDTSTKKAAFHSLGATNGTRTYASGFTLAPELVSVTRTATSSPDPFGGSTVTDYRVTFTFDTYVAIVNDQRFKVYKADGSVAVAFLPGQCEPATGAVTTQVLCDVSDNDADPDDANLAAVRDAVLYAVEANAVTAKDAAGNNLGYQNYATSKVPS